MNESHVSTILCPRHVQLLSDYHTSHIRSSSYNLRIAHKLSRQAVDASMLLLPCYASSHLRFYHTGIRPSVPITFAFEPFS